MIKDSNELFHYGTLHKSGRYPWGSGANPNQRNTQFKQYVDQLLKQGQTIEQISKGLGLTQKQMQDNLDIINVDTLRKQGQTDSEIAKSMGMDRTQLQARLAMIKYEQKQENINKVRELKDNQGMSNVAIGLQLDLPESTVRSLYAEGNKERENILKTTTDMLRSNVEAKGVVDVGTGAHYYIGGVSREKFNQAVALLRDEGYKLHNFQVEQVTNDKKTNMKALSKPDITLRDIHQNLDMIHQIKDFSEDGGRSFLAIQKPMDIDSKRIEVRYKEQGGAEMDGVIQVRRGVHDLSMGDAKYAQVRISVDGTHYLKGMAMYTDDLPKGVDLRFNTNKSNTGNKLDAMKPLQVDKQTGKIDELNPFGAIVRQQFKRDADGAYILNSKGEKVLSSAMNIVNAEGSWDKWGKNIASQMLSKQSKTLAEQQLRLKYDAMKDDYEEIMSLTNPSVKKKLLQSFADNADSSAVHLKAAALPRQRTQVILPINSLKEHEIYAPNFRNGEKVVLVRYPHGGIFEIPELTVNNSKANKALDPIRGAKDAVGIHFKVAERLSGADFDGDTVLVIPNNHRSIKTKPPLKQLEGFDNKIYKLPDNAPGIRDSKNPTAMTGRLMGDISNLITDMTIKGASDAELARAVKHSMVVIDAQKHHLNYKQSAKDNQIPALKAKYQGAANGGASTLISLATSDARVPKRTLRKAQDGGPIDPLTGEKVYSIRKDAIYTDAKGVVKYRTEASKKMAETKNAHTLSSGEVIEGVYADHANRLKSLANQARLSELNTPVQKRMPSAAAAYSNEVASLNTKLETALRNSPLERQAQVYANVRIKATQQARPDMDNKELKKVKSLALDEARNRVGAKKERIEVTPKEWDAIQAGAISPSKLKDILDNMKDEDIKALATPRAMPTMSPTKITRAKNLLAANHTAAEVADALGISVSTLNAALKEGA